MSQIVLKLIGIVLLVAPPLLAQSLAANIEESSQVPSGSPAYQPISGAARVKWAIKGTIGPESLAAGLFTAGIGTARNKPSEYGGSWKGFGQRYGMRFTGIATSNAMEAGLGALWGEDPRYVRASGEHFGRRVKNIVSMTFLAVQRDGVRRPAFARFVAVPGNNFISNTWRADSEANASDAALRTLWGFLGHMGGNAFEEFWPDVKKHVFHRGRHSGDRPLADLPGNP